MSYMKIKYVDKDGDVHSVENQMLGNGWGGAAYIWSALCEEYRSNRAEWLTKSEEDIPYKLLNENKLEAFEQLVLITTFDNAIIEREAFVIVAKAYRDFLKKYPPEKNTCCHLERIITCLERSLKNVEVKGICFYWTSVIIDPWCIYEETKDEEESGYRLYNIYKDKKHWYVLKSFEDKEWLQNSNQENEKEQRNKPQPLVIQKVYHSLINKEFISLESQGDEVTIKFKHETKRHKVIVSSFVLKDIIVYGLDAMGYNLKTIRDK